jgi:Na+-transporting NADH:ubiquinone oxidoreductase subunit NqrD
MNNRMQSHLFWGTDAPLSTLISVGLMIMATNRLAFALTVTGALVWTYGLTVLILGFAKPILPQKGREILWVFLTSFLGSLYLMFIYFVSPYLAMETTFIILLAPLYCIGSGICRRLEAHDPEESIPKAFLEALVLGEILVALALIREPLGFGTFSLPGGPQGIVTLISFESSLYFPVQVIAGSSGGLLLLGYGLTLFRRFKNRYSRAEEEK